MIVTKFVQSKASMFFMSFSSFSYLTVLERKASKNISETTSADSDILVEMT
jgi:hypothetical protein